MIQFFPELSNDKKEIPQIKSRIFESGFCKCIPLVYFDKSKIIENFFEPDVDFIYFYTIDDLKILINKILNDYESYKFIAENIYKKCNDNYKISDFVNKYILSN
jgi:spore maturation protein CgeB